MTAFITSFVLMLIWWLWAFYTCQLTMFSFTMLGAALCVQIQQLTYQQPLNKLGKSLNIHSQIFYLFSFDSFVNKICLKKGILIPICIFEQLAPTVLRGKTHADACMRSFMYTMVICFRVRTPSSGSSTPLPPSSKLSRKPSGASDTSVSGTTPSTRKGKPTPIEQRAPFRL